MARFNNTTPMSTVKQDLNTALKYIEDNPELQDWIAEEDVANLYSFFALSKQSPLYNIWGRKYRITITLLVILGFDYNDVLQCAVDLKDLNYFGLHAFPFIFPNKTDIKIPETCNIAFDTFFNDYVPIDDINSIEFPKSIKMIDLVKPSKNFTPKTTLSRILPKFNFPIIFDGKQYANGKELYNTIEEFRESDKGDIPTLYRVDSYKKSLAIINGRKIPAPVSFKSKAGLQGSDCPLFFESQTDAIQFIDTFNKVKGNQTGQTVNESDIHQARLSSIDRNFTRVKTIYGDALIQSHKDKYVDSGNIVKKDIF